MTTGLGHNNKGANMKNQFEWAGYRSEWGVMFGDLYCLVCEQQLDCGGYGYGGPEGVCEFCIRTGHIDTLLKHRAAELKNQAALLLDLAGKLKVPMAVAEIEELKQQAGFESRPHPWANHGAPNG
jgi:hypothetical protein